MRLKLQVEITISPIKKAIDKLKQTTKYFRDDATIEKNYNKMLGYIKKIR